MIQFYGYNTCSTCIKAKKVLKEAGVDFQDIDITMQPPSKKLLKDIVLSGMYPLKKLFNTSGQLYRSMNIKEKLPILSESQAIDLLATHGKLIKRPIITDGSSYVVGYDESAIRQYFL